MQSRLLWQKRMHKLGCGWETLGIINMYLFVWLGTRLWWQCGLITKPQPDVWMYESRQTMCESTESSSVNNLQAVHLVDIRDYSIRGWGDALGASERWLERPKLYSQPASRLQVPFYKVKQNLTSAIDSFSFEHLQSGGCFNFKALPCRADWVWEVK